MEGSFEKEARVRFRNKYRHRQIGNIQTKYLPYGLLASIEEYISWTGADVKNKYFYDNLNRVIEDWCHTYL